MLFHFSGDRLEIIVIKAPSDFTEFLEPIKESVCSKCLTERLVEAFQFLTWQQNQCN